MLKRHLALTSAVTFLAATASLSSVFAVQAPIIDTPPSLAGCTPKVVQFRLGGPTYFLSETGATVYQQVPEVLAQDVTIASPTGQYIQAIYYAGRDDYALPHEGVMSVVDGSNVVTNTYAFSSAVNGSDMKSYVLLPDRSTKAVRFASGTTFKSHEWFGAYFCTETGSSSSTSSVVPDLPAPIIQDPPIMEGCTLKVVQFRLGGPTFFLSETGSVVHQQVPPVLSTTVDFTAPAGKYLQGLYYAGRSAHLGSVDAINASGSVFKTYSYSSLVNGEDMNAYVLFPDTSMTTLRWNGGTTFNSHEWFGAYICPGETRVEVPGGGSSSSSESSSQEALKVTAASSESSSSASSVSSSAPLITPPAAPSGCSLRTIETKLDNTARFYDANGNLITTDSNDRIAQQVVINAPAGQYVQGFFYAGKDGHRAAIRSVGNLAKPLATYFFNATVNGKDFKTTVLFSGKEVRALKFGKSTMLLPKHLFAAYFCPLTQAPKPLTIEINGPPAQKYGPGEQDAVLASVKISNPNAEDIDLAQITSALEARSKNGGGLPAGGNHEDSDNVREVLSGVELRNAVTGQTISGLLLTGDTSNQADEATYDIYAFRNFTIPKNSETIWHLHVDFEDNGHGKSPQDGDRFRASLCEEMKSSGAECTYGIGLHAPASQFGVEALGASTNKPIPSVLPGGTVSGNFHTIAVAHLFITQRPQATADVAVSNKKNVNLLRFEANAQGRDILLTDLRFVSQTGSLVNGNNYSLWVDTNADGNVDTVLQSGVAPQSNLITFSQIQNGGYVVSPERSTMFEVHSDIASSLVNPPVLSLKFAGSSAPSVQAERAVDGYSLTGVETDGVCPINVCQITVLTAPSTIYQLRPQGSLYVTKSVTPIRNRQLLGGKLEDDILRVQFHAEYEDIDVTDLILTASGTNANSFLSNVDFLELYKPGSVTPFSSATVGGCSSTVDVPANSMCANMDNKQLVIPRDTDTDVLVRPRMKTDEQGSVSGQGISLFIDSTPTSWSGSGAVRARGLQSSNILARNDGDSIDEGEVFIGRSTPGSNSGIRGNRNVVVHSKVVSITNANPDPNGSAIATGLQRIGQFKFSAATHANTKNGSNDWTLSGIIFNVNATNVLLGTGDQRSLASDFYFYNKVNSTVRQQCFANVKNASGSFFVSCGNLPNSGVNTRIDAGTDATFVLEADVDNPKVANTNSTLQVSLTSFSTPFASAFGTAKSHLEWHDQDAVTSTKFFWMDYPETTVNSTSYQS